MRRIPYFLVVTFIMLFLSTAVVAQGIRGTFAIKNVVTGMLLRPLDANNRNETPIVSYSPTNWKCMTWDFDQVEGNTYLLRNLLTSKTFEPQEGKLAEGVTLEQQPLDKNNKRQKWEFLPAGDRSYLIRLKGTELYLTPSGEEGSTNSKIILAAKRPDKLQNWTIYEQHPTM